MWLKPVYERPPTDPHTIYEAPLYKTLARYANRFLSLCLPGCLHCLFLSYTVKSHVFVAKPISSHVQVMTFLSCGNYVCVCIHTYIYVCMYVCMYVYYTYTVIQTCIGTNAYMAYHTCTHIGVSLAGKF